jgi:hypothetical protein
MAAGPKRLSGLEVVDQHRFKIGQTVSYSPRAGSGAGVYQIAQLVPTVGDEPQYRIRSDTEPHLRAAKESELGSLNRR